MIDRFVTWLAQLPGSVIKQNLGRSVTEGYVYPRTSIGVGTIHKIQNAP